MSGGRGCLDSINRIALEGELGELRGGLGEVRQGLEALKALEAEVAALKAKLEKSRAKLRTELELVESFAHKAKSGALVTREEAAAYLGVSTKQLERWKAKQKIEAVPHLGSHVRFRASDVLRLASVTKED